MYTTQSVLIIPTFVRSLNQARAKGHVYTEKQ